MRCAILIPLLVSLAAPLSAQETFPYVAYVREDQTPVHAGPGQAYYATDVISRGQQVEVFETAGDWLAIRPPAGSFSWVPAREVELTDQQDVAVVVSDEVVAWIGTRIENGADHVWQLPLAQGAKVHVLDVKRRPGTAGKPAETWYRIQPPEGEFRFILAADVSTDPLPDEPREPEHLAGEDNTPPPRASQAEVAAAQSDPSEAVAETQLEIEESVQPAQFVAGEQAEETRPARPESPFREIGSNAPRGNSTPAAPRVASLDRSLPSRPEKLLDTSMRFDDRLMDLELQLATMAAKDPRQWRPETLRDDAERLVAMGKTTLERGRARLVIDKVVRLEELYQQQLEVNELPRRTIEEVRESALPTDPTQAQTKPRGMKIPDGVSYDGAGWLKPVYSAKRIAPPYALVDDNGKVLQYVTPAPGLNLNRYLKKPVGIYGQKGHLAEFQADHLSATRVVDLTKYQE